MKTSKKDRSDLIVALLATAIGLGLLMIMAFTWPTDLLVERYILFLNGLFGSGIGWLIGILISPYSNNEKSSFKTYITAAQGFITGFLVSKIDKVFELVIQDLTNNAAAQQTILVRVSFFVTSGTFVAIFTYITRNYWDGFEKSETSKTTQLQEEPSTSLSEKNNENHNDN
ncbi:hypothetical protein NIES2100_12620 [Calothrix sp. NIES-2100]|uniref:hypothetical protein n=1 Tax=Calothrix sp. NIES-2100 TaxID=1954172 RepID=UPI000B5F9FF9|nr:hypothetical protein NIES2100_12620 [Calothrix sp. NIES-2100]